MYVCDLKQDCYIIVEHVNDIAVLCFNIHVELQRGIRHLNFKWMRYTTYGFAVHEQTSMQYCHTSFNINIWLQELLVIDFIHIFFLNMYLIVIHQNMISRVNCRSSEVSVKLNLGENEILDCEL
jgi:hypothetical protein